MINFFKKIKLNRACPVKLKERNGGFTYVELIVVLSIFAMMSSLVMFNYGAFQAKVDIKVLASNIALKIVQAQKDAMSGKSDKWAEYYDSNWKPSYGVHFDSNSGSNTNFTYFADFSTPDHRFDGGSCDGTSECIDETSINKGDVVKDISYSSGGSLTSVNGKFDITFTRPNSGATFHFSTDSQPVVDYAQITISSGDGSATSCIQVYASGRIQIVQCPSH